MSKREEGKKSRLLPWLLPFGIFPRRFAPMMLGRPCNPKLCRYLMHSDFDRMLFDVQLETSTPEVCHRMPTRSVWKSRIAAYTCKKNISGGLTPYTNVHLRFWHDQECLCSFPIDKMIHNIASHVRSISVKFKEGMIIVCGHHALHFQRMLDSALLFL